MQKKNSRVAEHWKTLDVVNIKETSKLYVMITAQKMKFSIKNSFSSKCMFSIKDFFTYNEEILNGKLHFLRSGWHIIMIILPKEYDK